MAPVTGGTCPPPRAVRCSTPRPRRRWRKGAGRAALHPPYLSSSVVPAPYAGLAQGRREAVGDLSRGGLGPGLTLPVAKERVCEPAPPLPVVTGLGVVALGPGSKRGEREVFAAAPYGRAGKPSCPSPVDGEGARAVTGARREVRDHPSRHAADVAWGRQTGGRSEAAEVSAGAAGRSRKAGFSPMPWQQRQRWEVFREG